MGYPMDVIIPMAKQLFSDIDRDDEVNDMPDMLKMRLRRLQLGTLEVQGNAKKIGIFRQSLLEDLDNEPDDDAAYEFINMKLDILRQAGVPTSISKSSTKRLLDEIDKRIKKLDEDLK